MKVTYEAVRKRLLTAGTAAVRQLFEMVSQALADCSQTQHCSALSLAPFARSGGGPG